MKVQWNGCKWSDAQGEAPSPAAVDRRILALGGAGLADRECERLRLIRRDEARRESVAARTALLWALEGKRNGILYDFADLPAAETLAQRLLLPFYRGPEGAPGTKTPGQTISLAHCQGLAVAAVCQGGRVGIDVEALGRPLNHRAEDMAARFFSAGEQAEFSAAEDKEQMFLRIWGRKEALFKAVGGEILPDSTAAGGEFCFYEVEGFLITVYGEE